MGDHDLIVVGGGMAGLSCAFRLASAGQRPLVLEAASEPGGNVRSRVVESGHRLERGPHTFLASADQIFDLAIEAGLEDQLAQSRPAASARFIVRDGRLHRAPDGAGTFFSTRLLSWRSKMRLAAEPLFTGRGTPDDTALSFFRRRFGDEAARVIAGAFVSGVYAGDPATLSAPAAFPLFWGFEQDAGGMIRGAIRHQRVKKAERQALGQAVPPKRKGLWSFRKGLGQLSCTLGEKLGPMLRTDSPVDYLGQGEHGYLTGIDPELAELLAGIPMAPVAVASLGFRRRLERLPDGFGFLAPREQGVRSLGVLFPSRIFEGRAPDGGDLLTGYLGGMLDPEAMELDDEALAGLVSEDLSRLMGIDQAPDFINVVRHATAIPQLVVGHLERMEKVRARLERLPGLHLAGNYLRGVGIKDAVASGLETAEAVLKQGRTSDRNKETVA